jgi:ubiquinol-cytochrome c reductase cytochrome b subunit
LVTAWAGAEIAAFFGYVLPSGQFKFWLVTKLTDLIAALPIAGERLAEWSWKCIQQMGEVPALWPILLVFLLSLDVAVMHQEAWRKNSSLRTGVFLAAACAGALVFGLASGALIGSPVPSTHDTADIKVLPTPTKIVPDWYLLPYYALLRAMPDKLAGVTVAFAAMAVPLAWPWVEADVLRTGPMRFVWFSLCLIQTAVWIGLGYLGSRPPDDWVIEAARVLAVLYFAYFLVWPPVLRRIALQGAPVR